MECFLSWREKPRRDSSKPAQRAFRSDFFHVAKADPHVIVNKLWSLIAQLYSGKQSRLDVPFTSGSPGKGLYIEQFSFFLRSGQINPPGGRLSALE